MVVTKISRNGASSGYASRSALVDPTRRRFEIVNVASEGEPPIDVVVRAMSAGNRKRFLAVGTKPDPNNPTERIPDMDWYDAFRGRRNPILLALSIVDDSGEPMFPAAKVAAEAYLNGVTEPKALAGLDEIDDIEPAAEQLLLAAADRVSYLTKAAMDALMGVPEAPAPLASTSASSSDSEKPPEASTSSTPSDSSTM